MIDPSLMKNRYEIYKKQGFIEENSLVVKYLHQNYFDAAEETFLTAKLVYKASSDNQVKELTDLDSSYCSFRWVIIVSYYAMFYAATSILSLLKIKIGEKETHMATLSALYQHLVLTKLLEEKLFEKYKNAQEKSFEIIEKYTSGMIKRRTATYDFSKSIEEEDSKQILNNAQEIVKQMKILKNKLTEKEDRNEKKI